MPITIFEEDSPLKGAQLFANQAMRNFLSDTTDRTEPRFVALRAMMKGDMYFTDVRMPKDLSSEKISEKSHQFDIVGFRPNGAPVSFTFLCDSTFKITDFRRIKLENMSENTQIMAEHISKSLKSSGPGLR